MNRQLLYLLLVLILIVAVSPVLLRIFATDGFASQKGGLSQTSDGLSQTSDGLSQTSEGFAPPRVAPFSLDPPRPAEPRSILVSDPIQESFQGVSSSNKPVVAVSDTAYDAMTLKQRSDTLKDIQKMVREEIRATRTQPLATTNDSPDSPVSPVSSLSSLSATATMHPSSTVSPPSIQQGRDYQRRCEKDQDEGEGEDEYRCPKNPDGSCPPVPDMSQYIRKDQIPCWGCAIE